MLFYYLFLDLLIYGAESSQILNFIALLDIPVPPPQDTSLMVPGAETSDLPNSASEEHPSSETVLEPPVTVEVKEDTKIETVAAPSSDNDGKNF